MKQRGGIALTMVLWATSCIAMCAAGEETVAPDSASAGRPSEAIIYAALRPTAWDLVLVPADGSQPRRLTEHAALDYGACVSPDRRWVVFCSERSGNPDLYVIDLEGESPPRPLVSTSALEDAAAFSPDGEQLAYVSTASGKVDV